MTDEPAISYQELFARSVPELGPGQRPVRRKYDFAVAYPDPTSLPLGELAASLKAALQEEGKDLALYPDIRGYPPLREYVAAKLQRDRNIRVSPDAILLGDGSMECIHLLIEALVDPGDVVITEDFTYLGTLRTLRRFRADVRGVPCDDEGMLPEALESTIRAAIVHGKRPKMIYTIPTFQNPQGMTMPLERRRALLGLSERYGVPMLEDDCYVDLRYDGENVTSIRSLDDTGQMMYVGSFSKVIAPGMRMGYMTAPPEVMERVSLMKSGGGVNQFAALAVHRYATTQLEDHVDEINSIQRVKRDAMLAALGESFGSAAKWSHPEGGLYIWLQMPEEADLAAAHPTALEADVGYFPGPLFAPDGKPGKNCARLCFGYNTPEEVHEGIARLAQVFEEVGVLGP